MLPIRNLSAEVTSLSFEVPSRGGTTVDWRIERGELPPIRVDVKNRSVDLVPYLCAQVDGTATAIEPAHDHRLLFRSIENKFEVADPAAVLQGAWIVTQVRQEEAELRAAFHSLDTARVHFAIINNTHRDAYVIARDDVSPHELLSVFGLKDSPRMVFRRGVDPRDGRERLG
jgi:hypothetical protein